MKAATGLESTQAVIAAREDAAVLISGTKRTAGVRHVLKASARLSATGISWANLHGSKAP